MMKPCEIMSWTPIIENISPISAGFQLKVSIVNCEKTACKDPLGIQSKNAEISSLFKFFMESRFASCMNGLSLTKVISFSLCFLSRLSGIKKNPYITFTKVIIAPKYMGTE
ncbi:hypothetical protein D3C74_301960 [compost metagenome]